MKNKAFTLVELLAVIAILAIIALITTPIMIDYINDSKIKTRKNSVQLYGREIENQIKVYMASNNGKIPSGVYYSKLDTKGKKLYLTSDNIELVGLTLDYNGDNIACDEIRIDLSGNVFLDKCKYKIDKYIYTDKSSNEYFYYGDKPIYKDSKLAGSTPKLNGLIPVVYKNNNWVVANTSDEWYNYENQEWANAVILKDGITKTDGQTVSVDGDDPEALAMFVWIPRYEYKIEGQYGTHIDGTAGTYDLPGEIKVNFISSETTTPSSGYRIHPAFWWDNDSDGIRDTNEELNGIWVGKFETSHTTLSSSTTSNNLGCSTENCTNAEGLRILPNKVSLRYNNVSNFFFASRSIENSSTFNLASDKIDTHMMKNSEWGSVVYLSQSIYGKYGNVNYSGINKEIYPNKSINYITGNSNGTPSKTEILEQCPYNNTNDNCGIGASTTGNITGIYDMNTDYTETAGYGNFLLTYVMGVMVDSNGNPRSGYNTDCNSGFNGTLYDGTTESLKTDGVNFPNSKYYDVYDNTVSSNNTCNNEICYGHALSETAGWSHSSTNTIQNLTPWFLRDGVFGRLGYYGNAKMDSSFRISFINVSS